METPAGSGHRIRFGEFELDSHTRELRAHEQRLSLQEQPFQILLALLERPGQLVAREELIKRLWPRGTFVDFDHSLNTAVNRLRSALEDSAEHPRFIEGLPRRGYRFLAQVTVDGPPKPTPSIGQEFAAVNQNQLNVESAAYVAPAPIGSTRNTNRWPSVVAAIFLALIAAGVTVTVILHFRQVPHAEQRRSIVLADFTNTTGDPIFEDTLRQGLVVQLEQSPFLDVVPDGQIAQTLSLMGQPPEAKINAQVANQICKRIGSLAWVDGSIANVDSEYVLGLRAVNCQTARTLAQIQVGARNKKEVLGALGSASTQLRTKLGESLASMQKFDTPLDQATTPSLEALQAYSLGRKAMEATEDLNAVLLLQRAVQLDPNFALAYSSLGMAYMNVGQTMLGAVNSKKAYDLRAHVSDREKFYIESHYLQNVTGNLEKARAVYELWAETYPNDTVPRVNLAEICVELGQYDCALAEELEGFRIDPANAISYPDRMVEYIYLNRLQDAQKTFQEALTNNLDSPRLHPTKYVLDLLRNDQSGMMEQVSWGAGKPGVEEVLFALEAETAAYKGRLAAARELSRRAVSSALGAQEKETAATYDAFSGLREALIGKTDEAGRHVTSALRLSAGRDVQATAALTMAFVGENARAQNLTRDLDRTLPEDTVVQFNYLPAIRAQLALNAGDYREAIKRLEVSAAYELGDADAGDKTVTLALYPIYVRGQAYLAAHDGQQAAREFQKILDHPGVAQNRLVGPLSRLGLARAYKLQGDAGKARAAYQDFLSLWRDADPGLPILKQAKSECEKLN